MKSAALRILLLVTITFSSLPAGFAANLQKVEMPDSLAVGNKQLVLNGMGLRTATVALLFKVKVYVAGLYLPKKVTTAEEAENAPFPKEVRMHFLREVSAGDIQSAWDNGLWDNNDRVVYENMKHALEKLKALAPNVKEGETLTVRMLEESVELFHNDKSLGKVTFPLFSKVLLRAWIGPKPPNSELKQGLLGPPAP